MKLQEKSFEERKVKSFAWNGYVSRRWRDQNEFKYILYEITVNGYGKPKHLFRKLFFLKLNIIRKNIYFCYYGIGTHSSGCQMS